VPTLPAVTCVQQQEKFRALTTCSAGDHFSGRVKFIYNYTRDEETRGGVANSLPCPGKTTMNTSLRLLPAVLGISVILSSCGGGGGGAGSYGGLPPATAAALATIEEARNPPATVPDPVARPLRTTVYTFQLGTVDASSFDTFSTELTSPALAGYLLDRIVFVDATARGQWRAIYQRKGQTARYEHRFVSTGAPLTLADFQAQGAEGYRLTPGSGAQPKSVFSKVFGEAIQYGYVDAIKVPLAAATSQELLRPLNDLGKLGYCGTQVQGTGFALVKETPSTSRCVFELVAAKSGGNTGFVAEQNEQGAKGSVFVTSALVAENVMNLYVRDETQTSSFKFEAVDVTATSRPNTIEQAAELLAVLNREGAVGARPLRTYQDGGRPYILFMTAFDCRGLLC